MADFTKTYETTIRREGGYKLTNNKGDRGGQTYAGIARNRHPEWPGWVLIDSGKPVPVNMVFSFYKSEFWDKVSGDDIQSPEIAETLYDFGVNVGPATACKLAQKALRVSVDGKFGPVTLSALNAMNANQFLALYALYKIGHYRDIVDDHPDQIINFKGWVNRSLEGVLVS